MAPIGWQDEVLREISQIFYENLQKADAKRPRADDKIYRTPTPTSKGCKLRPKLHARGTPSPNSSTKTLPPKQDTPTPQSSPEPKLERKPKPPQAFRNLGTPGTDKKAFTSLAKEWTWLNDRIRDIQRNKKLSTDRKGDLPLELIRSVWGKYRGRHASEISATSPAQSPMQAVETTTDTAEDVSWEAKYIKRKSQREKGPQVPETLMDVFLQSWVYFDHSHGDPAPKTERPVHAKYCDGYFGHFLLPNGDQIHGSSTVSIKALISDLRSLLARLRHQIGNTQYREIPIWKIPKQEAPPEFIPPDPTPFPPLHPIEGLLPIPADDIPEDTLLPTLEAFVPKPQPKYVPPTLMKPPMLKIPPIRNCSKEENAIDYSLYKELPLPVLKLPAPLPLATFVEPSQLPLPPQPVAIEPATLPPVRLEVIPSYRAPELEQRPCERSYYSLDEGVVGVCDGLCGKAKLSHSKEAARGPCIAKPPSLSAPPSCPPIQFVPEPIFEQPTLAPMPPFQKPKLRAEPVYIGPPKPGTPVFIPPPPPMPIGYLVGPRPVFLIDCSGTMAGDRIKAVTECMRALFNTGGQVEVAATHVDVIMYSFDAWSYGSMEVDKMRRMKALNGEPLKYWTKNVDVMQEKTAFHMENALSWMLRWQPAGTTNLLRAIEVAMQRNSDGIYLFTDGKPDKPVLILNMLKRVAKEKGRVIPINTIGMATNRLGERFLKRLANATGGTFREHDMKWSTRTPTTPVNESVDDVMWAQNLIETHQRKNVADRKSMSIKDILTLVKTRFEEERLGPRMELFRKEDAEAMHDHEVLLKVMSEENAKTLATAQIAYDQKASSIMNENTKVLEKARAIWKQKVDNVAKLNNEKQQTYRNWEESVEIFKEEQKKNMEDARLHFLKDLKAVEERNAHNMLHAKDIHDAQIASMAANNEALVFDRDCQQEQLLKSVAATNSAAQFKYEEELKAIESWNDKLIQNARLEFEARCNSIKKQNAQLVEEAEEKYARRLEEVKTENGRRKSELALILENLRILKETSLTMHQEEVDAAVAAHDANIQNVNRLNKETENQAKLLWKQACEVVANENRVATDKTLKDWETETKQVQEGNTMLALRRSALQAKKEEVEKRNEEFVKERKIEWKRLRAEADFRYEEDVEAARLLHFAYCDELEEKRGKDLKKKLVAHQAKVVATETYNLTIQPYVEASRLIEDEVHRIERFLNHLIEHSPLTKEDPGEHKRSLERSLDILTSTEKPCKPNMVIEALQEAFRPGKEGVGRRRPTRAPNVMELTPKKRSRFAGMVPIHPERVPAHGCVSPSREDMLEGLTLEISGLLPVPTEELR